MYTVVTCGCKLYINVSIYIYIYIYMYLNKRMSKKNGDVTNFFTHFITGENFLTT